jgi:hypothetical protein
MITKNLDLLALNFISNFAAKESHKLSNLRIAYGEGQIKIIIMLVP